LALYRFGPFQLDEEARLLASDGEPVALPGKVFDTLIMLVRNHGRVLEKEQLLAAIWPGAVVEEANLTQSVSTLRKALGDSAKDRRFIATIARRGYSFVAPVIEDSRQDLGSTLEQSATNGTELVAPAMPRPSVANAGSRRTPVRYGWLIVALAVAILAIGFGLRLKLWRFGVPSRVGSLAVLPFQNLSNDPEQEFFAEGMTEQLITSLSKIRALRVISKTSAMQYRGKHKIAPEVARQLGVEAIVEGSVKRLGSKVRITVQLIDARADQYLWAESYSRDVSEVLDIEGEVARAIANQIHVRVTSAEREQLATRRTADPEVNDLVLRGRYYADKFTEASLNKAIGYLEQAIARDPNYAPAHSGLAYVYLCRAMSETRPREVMPKLKLEAERALQLDETMAEAHVSLSYGLLFYDWDWPQAEIHLRRALQLNASAADAHLVYAGYLNALGRSRKALAEVRLAEALDPLSLPVQQMLLFSMLGARRYNEVIAQVHRVLEREPNFAAGYLMAALAYTEKGQMDRAIEAVEKAGQMESNIASHTIAAHVYAAKGDRGKAERLLKELTVQSKQGYVCAYELAHAYVKLGDKQQAYEWLEKGKQDRADCMVWLLVEPWMDPLRGDRRYRELINHIGLATGKAGPKP
jgi:TolB-like protein/DNA-binding winged helix-turn-helix (wHTH) protein/Tfp pilus assembly protein PilF